MARPVRPGVSYFTPLRQPGRTARPQGGASVGRDELYDVVPEGLRDGFFCIGKIIQVRVFEDEWDERTRRMVADQERAPHMIFRRGVVIGHNADMVKCLVIKTYQGQGTTRADVRVNAGKHAVVYTSSRPPALPPSETHVRPAIHAEPLHANDRLQSTARLDYDGEFLVPYDRPVRAIAQVTPDSIATLRLDYARISGERVGHGGNGGHSRPRGPYRTREARPS